MQIDRRGQRRDGVPVRWWQDQQAVAVAAVDLEVRIEGDERRGQRARRLGFAQDEEPVVPQCEGEQPSGALLEVRGEVDEHVATHAQVDAWEGRAPAEIV